MSIRSEVIYTVIRVCGCHIARQSLLALVPMAKPEPIESLDVTPRLEAVAAKGFLGYGCYSVLAFTGGKGLNRLEMLLRFTPAGSPPN